MRILLLTALLLFSYKGFAQSNEDQTPTQLVNMASVEAGLHGMGLGYEHVFTDKWVVNLSTGLGRGYFIDDPAFYNGFSSSFIINQPVAYFRSNFKYLYNREKRLSKGKGILNNSGNYIGFQIKYTTRRVFGSTEWDQSRDPQNRTLLNEVHWGIQRPLGQNFLFNFHLGLGFGADFDFKNSQLYPALGLQFAYVFWKKE